MIPLKRREDVLGSFSGLLYFALKMIYNTSLTFKIHVSSFNKIDTVLTQA